MRLRSFLIGILLTTSAFAQMSSFPKPSYFRETFQKAQTKVELKDPVRLKDFLVSGKLELSLRDYLQLVMANNTGIQIQLLSVEIPKTAIQTALGAWDPRAIASFSTTASTTLPINATTAENAATATKALTQPYSLQYTQTLQTGTTYTAMFSGSKTEQTNSYNNYNPALTANMRFAVTQPLLQNRGTYFNRLPLMMAQSNYKQSVYALSQQLLTLVSNAETAYWNVVSARESLRVQEKARETQGEFLKYMQQQLDLGAISPLDIFNPEANVAAADLAVSQARFTLLQAEDALRQQIAVDLDPQLRTVPIELTEPVEIPASAAVAVDRERAVQKAVTNHPAITQALEKMNYDDFGIQSARNGLLPNLSFSLYYQSDGTGGDYNPSLSTILGSGGASTGVVQGGIANALSQMWGFGFPTYNAGLTLTLPIRSKAASAAMAAAVIQKRTDTLNLRNQQETIRLNILTAVTRLEGSKDQLRLAIVQRDLAAKNLDAENQKYQLGTDINQNVINAQQQLTQAESSVVSNQIGVQINLMNLYFQTGELLEQRGIIVK
jgi:outer membrane protein TolC